MAISPAQRAANRANARHSTGPITPEGKARVSRNALQHGLFAQAPVLDHEDADAYRQLVDDLAMTLAPVGALEWSLVERIALALWRQQRLMRAEQAQLQSQLDDRPVARQVSHALKGPYDGEAVKESDLGPLDEEKLAGYRKAFAELNRLKETPLGGGWPQLATAAPLIYADLLTSAEESAQTWRQATWVAVNDDHGFVSPIAGSGGSVASACMARNRS